MKNGRIDIASIRREQIIDAAIAVIAEQGLHHLSLSEIETRAAMSRGQLTYYTLLGQHWHIFKSLELMG